MGEDLAGRSVVKTLVLDLRVAAEILTEVTTRQCGALVEPFPKAAFPNVVK